MANISKIDEKWAKWGEEGKKAEAEGRTSGRKVGRVDGFGFHLLKGTLDIRRSYPL